MSALKFGVQIASGKRKLADISDFVLSPNKINFLFGESGIGKSIISKAIFGLLDADDLSIKINKSNYKDYLNSSIKRSFQKDGFFVFQEPSTHLNPLLTLSKQLSEGSLKNFSAEDEMSIIRFLWDDLDEDSLRRLLNVFPKPYRPSGGEKQRILLAMAFKKIKKYIDSKTARTALFIFDEPSGSLDNRFRNLFIQLLMECYKQKPFTTLIITHDYSIISEIENNYKGLSGSVEYLELFRMENGLKLSSFSKNAYLDWIKNQSWVSSDAIHAGHILVKLYSDIRIFGRRLTFHKNNFNAPEDLLEIKRGELIYLKAQSGVGKTTVAKIIMGLIKPQKMAVTFGQKNATHKTSDEFWRKNIWGNRASMVFQHADESLNQNATVLEVFKALSKHNKVDIGKVMRRIQELFEVELKPSFLNKKIKFLSGGQKQRINILRSFVLDTDILILDEPLNGLDLNSSNKVIEKIKQRQADGKAILLISHNEEIFDKIVKPENIYYLKSS